MPKVNAYTVSLGIIEPELWSEITNYLKTTKFHSFKKNVPNRQAMLYLIFHNVITWTPAGKLHEKFGHIETIEQFREVLVASILENNR